MLPRGAGRLVTPPSDKMRALGSQPVCVRVCVCAVPWQALGARAQGRARRFAWEMLGFLLS